MYKVLDERNVSSMGQSSDLKCMHYLWNEASLIVPKNEFSCLLYENIFAGICYVFKSLEIRCNCKLREAMECSSEFMKLSVTFLLNLYQFQFQFSLIYLEFYYIQFIYDLLYLQCLWKYVCFQFVLSGLVRISSY